MVDNWLPRTLDLVLIHDRLIEYLIRRHPFPFILIFISPVDLYIPLRSAIGPTRRYLDDIPPQVMGKFS